VPARGTVKGAELDICRLYWMDQGIPEGSGRV
jgi:hypothetical protein